MSDQEKEPRVLSEAPRRPKAYKPPRPKKPKAPRRPKGPSPAAMAKKRQREAERARKKAAAASKKAQRQREAAAKKARREAEARAKKQRREAERARKKQESARKKMQRESERRQKKAAADSARQMKKMQKKAESDRKKAERSRNAKSAWTGKRDNQGKKVYAAKPKDIGDQVADVAAATAKAALLGGKTRKKIKYGNSGLSTYVSYSPKKGMSTSSSATAKLLDGGVKLTANTKRGVTASATGTGARYNSQRGLQVRKRIPLSPAVRLNLSYSPGAGLGASGTVKTNNKSGLNYNYNTKKGSSVNAPNHGVTWSSSAGAIQKSGRPPSSGPDAQEVIGQLKSDFVDVSNALLQAKMSQEEFAKTAKREGDEELLKKLNKNISQMDRILLTTKKKFTDEIYNLDKSEKVNPKKAEGIISKMVDDINKVELLAIEGQEVNTTQSVERQTAELAKSLAPRLQALKQAATASSVPKDIDQKKESDKQQSLKSLADKRFDLLSKQQKQEMDEVSLKQSRQTAEFLKNDLEKQKAILKQMPSGGMFGSKSREEAKQKRVQTEKIRQLEKLVGAHAKRIKDASKKGLFKDKTEQNIKDRAEVNRHTIKAMKQLFPDTPLQPWMSDLISKTVSEGKSFEEIRRKNQE